VIEEESYILGIAEKPQAARRIAYALDAKNSPILKKINNVPVFVCKREEKAIVIAPAVGHLFTLSPIGKSWDYPVLDYEWIPSYLVNKKSNTKNFIEVFNQLSKKASQIILMTDFDREGEVIGFLILKLLLGKDQAERMKFSTLTKRDIVKAYDEREKALDVGFLNSGLIRHYVDWLYGINYSRALSLSLQRSFKRFKTISIGRVQGPTLAFVVFLEKAIKMFVPVPYWIIESEVKLEGKKYKTTYEKTKIETKNEVLQILKDCKDKVGIITNVEENKSYLYPFPPFNLGDLQREAYRHFRFSPSKTLELAEKLYLQALISYPRTDSQKLPMTLGHKSILTKLKDQKVYSQYALEILNNKKFKPREGKKVDAAHPAIHPTGNKAEKTLLDDEKKIYDLIVKRYLSVFGEKAIVLKTLIEISVNNHLFSVKGHQVLDSGWIKYYAPYYSLTDNLLPSVKLNDKVIFTYIDGKQLFTTPAQRFNESTLLKRMEDEKIGTKATRAGIIQTLFNRGYIEGKEIKPTPLGESVVNVLNDHYPILIKADMTRNLERLMERVEKEKITNVSEVIVPLKKELQRMLILFNKKEKEIGFSLYKNLHLTEQASSIVIGKCVSCKKGDLRILTSKKTNKRFVACSSYFDKSIKCNATYPLPNTGTIKPTNKKCEYDGLPLVEWIKGRRKQLICISPSCPSKKRSVVKDNEQK